MPTDPIAQLDSSRATKRVQAALALGRARNAAATPALARALVDRSAQVVRVASVALVRIGGPAAHAALAKGMETMAGTTRHDAIRDIVAQGDAAAAFVTFGVREGGEALRSALLWELQKLPRPWAIEALAAGLSDRHLVNRLTAARSLAWIGGAEVVGPLQDALNDRGEVLSQVYDEAPGPTRPAGQALASSLGKNLDYTVPGRRVAEVLGACGDSGAVMPLVHLAHNARMAEAAIVALEQVLARVLGCASDADLEAVAQLDNVIQEHYKQRDPDEPNDLTEVPVASEPIDTSSLRRRARAELDRRASS